MKIYQIRAKRGKLKYSDEHIHFTLDGTSEYNWRKILSEINNSENLSLPNELLFEISKIKLKNINSISWLKSDFMLPIWNKKLIDFISLHINEKIIKYSVLIKDNNENLNPDFIAFYLQEHFECLNYEKTEFREYNGKKTLDLKQAVFLSDLEYPLIFKIKGMSINNSHYCTENGKKLLENYDLDGFEFIEK